MKCVICGKDFYNKNSKAICCSIECRKKRKSQTASMNYKNRKNGIYVKEFESFYNFNVNKIGKELFDKYWDYEANLINPNEISKFSHKKVFIRCIDTHNHGTYEISASVFSKGHRCPYCNTFASGKVHIKDSLGYMLCEIVDSIDNDTHTLFIGKLIEADIFSDSEAMSYQFYQEHKEELLKVTTTQGKTAWICTICGYVCYYDELPNDYKCPICGVPKELFNKK